VRSWQSAEGAYPEPIEALLADLLALLAPGRQPPLHWRFALLANLALILLLPPPNAVRRACGACARRSPSGGRSGRREECCSMPQAVLRCLA